MLFYEHYDFLREMISGYQGLCVCRSPVWGLNITSGHFRSSVLFEVQSFEVGSFSKFSRSKFSRSKLGLSKFSRSKFSPSKLGLSKFSRSKLGHLKFSRSKFSRWILQSDSEQFIYNWKTGKKNTDLDQGNWRQHNGMEKRNSGKIYIYRRYISRVKATRKL